jgi:ketosteroid isomerase-like protein
MKLPAIMLLLTPLLAPAATDPKVEKELLAAMDSLKQATLRKDTALMSKLLHEDVTYSYPTGITETKTQVLQGLPASKVVYMEFSEPTFRVVGKTVLVKNVTDMRQSDAPDAPVRLNALYIWIKGAQGWRLVVRQPTMLRDPNASRGGRRGPPAPTKN